MTVKSKVIKEEGVEARTLLLSTSDGEIRITIPAGSRVTFGPTVPYAPKPSAYPTNNNGYSLRVYANSKNDSLIGVFSGVHAFRDIKIPHAKLIVREAGKSVWKSDEEGFKVEEEVKRSEHWMDPLRLLESNNG